MSKEATQLAPVGPTGVDMLPAGASGRVIQAIQEYKALQVALDAHLDKCVVQLDGKPFRTKAYWNAVATAFGVNVEIVEERRVEFDGDWGYEFICKATAGNRFALGDGACTRSEKVVYQSVWNKANRRKEYILDENGEPKTDPFKTAKQATLHNVRAHAYTRARGRAISHLVGFGEVTAEEVSADETNFPEVVDAPPPAAVSAKDAKLLEDVKKTITECLTEWAERMFVKLPETSKREHFENKRSLLANNVMGIDFWPGNIKLEDAQACLRRLKDDLAIVMRDVPPAQAEESKPEPAKDEGAPEPAKDDAAAQGELPT